MSNLTVEQLEVLSKLADALVPSKDKKAKKEKKQFALEVNGRLMQERAPSAKAATKAAIRIMMNNPSANIELYEYVGPVTVDIPVSGVKSMKKEK